MGIILAIYNKTKVYPFQYSGKFRDMIKITVLVCSIISGLIGCGGASQQSNNSVQVQDSTEVPEKRPVVNKDFQFQYKLDKPDETFKLNKDLEEISGLGICSKGKVLYAVQDELGTIFKLSKETGEILDKIKFHKAGDYEGIEMVDDQIYIVKSTGTIYKVINPGKKTQQLEKFNGFLSRENDVEGLAYDKKNNRLLVACKGIPATGESFEVIRYKKVIYGFDLDSKSIQPDPVYTIQLENIRNYLQQHKHLKEYEKLVNFFSAGKENLTFNPSAIAVHPQTQDIYIISSSGKVMCVLNEAGDVVHIEKLKKDIHAQPEGLTFEDDGTMYISNEAKGGKPKIHRFKPGR